MASVQAQDERIARLERLTANLERFADLDTRLKKVENTLTNTAISFRKCNDIIEGLAGDILKLIAKRTKDREQIDAQLFVIALRLDFTMREVTFVREVQGLLDLQPRKIKQTLVEMYDAYEKTLPAELLAHVNALVPRNLPGAPTEAASTAEAAPVHEPSGPRLVTP
jgi:hypothetical protein